MTSQNNLTEAKKRLQMRSHVFPEGRSPFSLFSSTSTHERVGKLSKLFTWLVKKNMNLQKLLFIYIFQRPIATWTRTLWKWQKEEVGCRLTLFFLYLFTCSFKWVQSFWHFNGTVFIFQNLIHYISCFQRTSLDCLTLHSILTLNVSYLTSFTAAIHVLPLNIIWCLLLYNQTLEFLTCFNTSC